MKELYIARHAKSSWSFDLPDHDRPLGVRGRRDVRKMGKYLRSHVPAPELIVTSTASRAFYTALHYADAWDYPEDEIAITKDLFHASHRSIIPWLGQFQEDRLAIFGHNPGFTELVNLLSNEPLDNLPTAGIYGLRFNIQSWRELENTTGETSFYFAPKLLPR